MLFPKRTEKFAAKSSKEQLLALIHRRTMFTLYANEFVLNFQLNFDRFAKSTIHLDYRWLNVMLMNVKFNLIIFLFLFPQTLSLMNILWQSILDHWIKSAFHLEHSPAPLSVTVRCVEKRIINSHQQTYHRRSWCLLFKSLIRLHFNQATASFCTRMTSSNDQCHQQHHRFRQHRRPTVSHPMKSRSAFKRWIIWWIGEQN